MPRRPELAGVVSSAEDEEGPVCWIMVLLTMYLYAGGSSAVLVWDMRDERIWDLIYQSVFGSTLIGNGGHTMIVSFHVWVSAWLYVEEVPSTESHAFDIC
jgi:hypothetical protein